MNPLRRSHMSVFISFATARLGIDEQGLQIMIGRMERGRVAPGAATDDKEGNFAIDFTHII